MADEKIEVKVEGQETEIKAEVKPDLLTRVSQVKEEEKKEDDGKFNINDLDAKIEKIQDPAIKEEIVAMKKSLLRGENQKYQEIASLRKQYEQRLGEIQSWTPERLQQEMSKPDFVQAAQTLYGNQSPNGSGLTEQQWSALSDTEKAELNQLKQKIVSLERNSYEAVKSAQDAQLKAKYADYDPQEIDKLTEDLMKGKLQATREHLYKVVRFEKAVEKAYQLGLLDRNEQNKEKINGMTYDGSGNIQKPVVVEKEKKESTQQFFQRSYQEHAKKK